MRLAQVLTVSILTLAMTAEVAAERRPGLGGKYAARNMTAAQGSLTILAGPTSTQALGYNFKAAAGPGFNYNIISIDSPEIPGVTIEGDTDRSIAFGTIGAAYGITPELEAGVLLPLLLVKPENSNQDLVSAIPVFLTYAMDLGNFDAGVRLTADIPIADGTDFGLTVGVPFLFRFGGNSRLDAGIFVPLVFGDETGKSLSVPLRFSQSITPKIFAGIETGLLLPEFETEGGVIPVYAHAGYTLLAGGNVVDLALQVGLPSAVTLGEDDPLNPSGADVIAISVGTNVQMKF